MPFISHRDDKSRSGGVKFQEEAVKKSGWGETFGASLGLAVDEDLTTSTLINREGWRDRTKQVEKMIDEGTIDKEKYMRVNMPFGSKTPSYGFDYDKASEDFEDIKSSKILTEERNAMLKGRREYAEDVISRGPTSAQFLGAANAFMLDPVSIATMPISYSVGAARGLAAVGRTMLKAGTTEMAAETVIQGFVVGHKNDIDSPYGFKDAIKNIGTAAVGSSLLAGGGKGISEYITSVRAKVKDLPQTDELKFADETLGRMEETLKDNPLRKEGMTAKEAVKADEDYLNELEVKRVDIEKPREAPPAKEYDDVITEGKKDFSNKEQAVLKKTGELESYNKDMAQYNGRFNPAQEAAEPDLKGVKIDEQVRIKETGEVVTVKADAEVVYRQAKKRMDIIDTIAGCLNA